MREQTRWTAMRGQNIPSDRTNHIEDLKENRFRDRWVELADVERG